MAPIILRRGPRGADEPGHQGVLIQKSWPLTLGTVVWHLRWCEIPGSTRRGTMMEMRSAILYLALALAGCADMTHDQQRTPSGGPTGEGSGRPRRFCRGRWPVARVDESRA